MLGAVPRITDKTYEQSPAKLMAMPSRVLRVGYFFFL